MRSSFFTFLLLCGLACPGLAQTPLNLNGWQPNGAVLSIAQDNDYIYLGGRFRTMIKPGVSGAFTSGTGVQTTGAGEVINGFPTVEGTVLACVPDGSGGWFIGGQFSRVGGILRRSIAHILPDRTVDLIWDPNPNDGVSTLALAGSNLYVGGNFTSIGGQLRNGLVKLSTTGTGMADAAWNPNPTPIISGNKPVNALVVSGGSLFVGGSFTSIGGLLINNLAKLSTVGTGAADPTWNPNNGGHVNGEVNALTILDSDLYVGGRFSRIGGQSRNSLARLNINGTGAADATWNPNAIDNSGFAGVVHALTVSSSDLYVGGNFTNIGGQSRNHLAKLATNGTGLADPAWNPNPTNQNPQYFPLVAALVISGSDLYVGGNFLNIGGQSRNNLAKLSASGAAIVDANWDPRPNNGFTANDGVYALAVSGGDLYVGGQFTNIGGQFRSSLARLRKSDHELDLAWNPNPINAGTFYLPTVSALAISGSDLYVAGDFTNIGGQSRNRIAKISTNGLGTADAIWNPGPTNLNVNGIRWISALAISGSDLYVGGDFSHIGGQPRNCLAKLNTAGIGAADPIWASNISSGWVETFALSGSDLYVGGAFSSIGGQWRKNLAKLSTSGTGAVDPTWDPGPEAAVFTLALWGGELYVGGGFTNIGGQNRTYLAKVG